jgi:serine/threonine-protein kinase RsbW|tara:strand:+ start:153 stop:578 length:426 start_codon:yes stop_codon:yes gene_type:complete
MNANQSIRFASALEGITHTERMIESVCAEFSVGEEHYGEILISLTEAVNNAVVHGNKLDSNKMVSVDFTVDGDDMVFRVTDEGPGFDFENIPDPTSPENLEKPNGRGVFLMRSLADVCDFEELGRVAVLRFKDVVSVSVQG